MSEQVSATRTVGAPVAAVFAVLADPATHASIDGTGWVADVVDAAPLSAAGQRFRMAMYHRNHPDGDYGVVNEVALFDPPRAIGWYTGQATPDGVELGGWLWRYDLRELGPGETEVTHTYDWSGVPQYIRDRGITFPPFPPDHLANSLDHLAALGEVRQNAVG